jgi:hypothetical protein
VLNCVFRAFLHAAFLCISALAVDSAMLELQKVTCDTQHNKMMITMPS